VLALCELPRASSRALAPSPGGSSAAEAVNAADDRDDAFTPGGRDDEVKFAGASGSHVCISHRHQGRHRHGKVYVAAGAGRLDLTTCSP